MQMQAKAIEAANSLDGDGESHHSLLPILLRADKDWRHWYANFGAPSMKLSRFSREAVGGNHG